MRLIGLILLASSTLLAQQRIDLRPAQSAGFLIDLSGEWRMSPDDKAEYAAPGFNDSGWPILVLPRGETYFHGKEYWLRRHARLPETVDRSQVSLTLGALQDVYEVYVNGKLIGATGNFNSFEDAQIPRARTFDIPFDVLTVGDSLQIALHVRGILFYHPDWRLLDTGPYL